MFDSFVDCALIQVYVGPEEGTKRAVCEEGHWDGCITRVSGQPILSCMYLSKLLCHM